MDFSCKCCTPAKTFASRSGFNRHDAKYNKHRETPREKHKREYEIAPKHCLMCSQQITYKQFCLDNKRKFCSQSCSAKYSNCRRVPKCATCSNCGETLAHGRRYCNNTCKAQFERSGMIDAWLSGAHTGGWKNGNLSRVIRTYILEQANYTCEQCGCDDVNPFSGLSVIQVDHIDGNPTNHRRENLRALCPLCHAKTANYGGLNRGNGKFSKRLSYHREQERLK